MRSADDGNSMLKRNTEAECSQLEYAVEVPCLRPHEQQFLKVRTARRAQVSILVRVTTSEQRPFDVLPGRCGNDEAESDANQTGREVDS
jgi:hypothetical protein